MTPLLPNRLRARVAALLLAVLVSTWPATGPAQTEDDPVAILRAHLAARDARERSAALTRLVEHREYRPSRLSDWLHRGWAYPDTRPGTTTLDVPIATGTRGASSSWRPTVTAPIVHGR